MEYMLILFLILLLLLIVSIYVFLIRHEPSISWKKTVHIKLRELSEQSYTKDPVLKRSIIIELDKLLDFAIKQYGLSGTSMGDRLKRAQKYFDKKLYNEIWTAHKVRNKIAHEFDYVPSKKILDESISTLHRAIKQLI